MRLTRSLLAASILVTLASVAIAQSKGDKPMTGSPKSDIATTLEAMEHSVSDAIKNQDSKTFLSFVEPDAWSVDAMGFTPVSQFVTSINDIKIKSYSIEGYKVSKIDRDAYVAIFTWKCEGSYKGQPIPPVTYCSTVWAKRGGQWKAVFHQESVPMPMEGTQPPAAGSH